ncbi:MAG: V-type ATP synthase subunit A, partial [bacterium]
MEDVLTKTLGKVTGIIANLVIVKAEGPVAQNEICFIEVPGTKLMAEVIKINGDEAYVQVFESTRGLRIGAKVEFEGHMLEVTLGPGLLSKNFDGLENDLNKMDGVFLRRGEYILQLGEGRKWDFKPIAKAGDQVRAGDWLGEVDENYQPHKIMVPFIFKGNFTVKKVIPAGAYEVN